jgi:hypothetical protein
MCAQLSIEFLLFDEASKGFLSVRCEITHDPRCELETNRNTDRWIDDRIWIDGLMIEFG